MIRLTVHIALLFISSLSFGQSDTSIFLKHVISGNITPKSVTHSGDGLFSAHNMMYRHTVTFYDRQYKEVAVIDDEVDFSEFDSTQTPMMHWGSPVEGVFSHYGKYLWVSNYEMKGGDFIKPGCDNCSGKQYDDSYLYKISTWDFSIKSIVKVGAVPKYLTVSDDDKWLAVSNWSSGDVSIVDVETEKEVKRIDVGRFPRGLAFKDNVLFVALMGESRLAMIDMNDYSVKYIEGVGMAPRHICIDKLNNRMYCSLNQENKIVKISLDNFEMQYLDSGNGPRSMALTEDGKWLYCVNYFDNTFSKIRTDSLEVVYSLKTNENPIGITLDEFTGDVWVACYSGHIMVFNDFGLKKDQLAFSAWNDLFKFPMMDTVKLDSAIVRNENDSTILAKEDDEKAVEAIDVKDSISSLTEVKDSTNLISSANTVKEEIQVDNKVEEVKEIPKKQTQFYIIAGSFKMETNATKLRDKIAANGYDATLVNRSNGLTSVSFGEYASFQEAQNALIEIKKNENPQAWILKSKP